MINAREELTDLEKLERLVVTKRILSKREGVEPGDYAKEWLELSQQFAEIDAKANAAYCAGHAKHYAGQSSDALVSQPLVIEIEQREPALHGWQNIENMGGG
jgi:hypothetical protein